MACRGGGPGGDAGTGDGGSVDAAGPAHVSVVVTGPGRVTSTPPGIDCGGGGTACAADFAVASITLVTDEATTVRWGGACTGNGDCVVALGEDRAVTAATFAPLRRTFDDADHGFDTCHALAAGPADSVVITGEVQRLSEGYNAWTRAYDASGDVLWTYELSTPSEGPDRGNGVVVLADGSAVVAGSWYSGSNTRRNYFLLHLSATGAQTADQESDLIGDDEYDAIARDASGGLIVAGVRPDAAGNPEAWIRALGGDGLVEAWAVTRTGTAMSSAGATGVAVDSAGDVVVVGRERDVGTGDDGWILKLSPLGVARWSIPVAGPDASTDAVSGVAIGPDDRIAVVASLGASSSIRVLDADGTPRWDVTAADGIGWHGVAVDAAGNVVVAGSLGTGLIVRKYTPGGVLVWQRIVPDAQGEAVAIDHRGDVLVCGAAAVAGKTDVLVLRLFQ